MCIRDRPQSCRDEATLDQLRALEPDVILVAAYGKLLPQALLDIPKTAILNVHSSLLPQYRGAAPINWAVLNGDKETGVTIQYMAAELDAGDILLACLLYTSIQYVVLRIYDKPRPLKLPPKWTLWWWLAIRKAPTRST